MVQLFMDPKKCFSASKFADRNSILYRQAKFKSAPPRYFQFRLRLCSVCTAKMHFILTGTVHSKDGWFSTGGYKRFVSLRKLPLPRIDTAHNNGRVTYAAIRFAGIKTVIDIVRLRLTCLQNCIFAGHAQLNRIFSCAENSTERNLATNLWH